MLEIVNVIEEDRFGGPQRWIWTVSGRLKDLGLEQYDPSYVDSDWSYKELDQQGIETRRKLSCIG